MASKKTNSAPGAGAELKEVEFLVSPTGKFNLSYEVGDIAFFPTEQANELIESGFAKSTSETASEEVVE